MFLGDSGLQEIFYPWTNQNNMLELSLIFNCLLLYGFIKYTISYFNYSKSFIIKKILPFYFGLLLLQIIFFLLYMFGAISKIPQPIRLSFIISILIGIPLCFIIALTSGKENRIQRRNFILSIFPPFLLIFLLIVDLFFGLPIEDFADTHFSSFFGISLMLSLVLLAVSTGHRTNLLKAEKEKALQKNLSDQKQINLAISRFVPNEFLLALGKSNIKEVKLGDSIAKEVTVFFSDIRDYTSLSEQMTPEENFQFVNAYNVQMGPIIQQDKGFVNQYLGDGIMAIFPESPTDALRAAIKMQQVLQSYNQQRVQEGRKAIRVGMGMHTGSLIMGITGDENRLDAATISDSVNSAARIESLTKHYGVSILLSEASIAKLTNPTEFHFRYLGEVQVKGKKQALKIYECFDGDLPEIVNLKLTTLSLFEEGIQHYFNQSFTQAALAFKSVLKQNPVDSPAKLFLNKAGRLITNGVDDDWTGVEMMADK